jgi:HD superfamily phosphohydrolase
LSGTVGDFFGGSARKVRDVVWGDVPIDRAVRTLLETAPMGRLKGMAALSFASTSFPTARHTCFDHAVGVYNLTRLTLKRIIDSGAYVEDRDVRAAFAAALLLEVGRYPYASAVESIVLPGMIPRTELSRRLIEKTEVSEVLRQEWDLEPHNVFRLVARDEDPARLPRDLTPTEHLLRDILFGSLDTDSLDRMVRDARGAKVRWALVDAEALIEHLRIVGQDNRAVLAMDEAGVGLLQSLVFCRYLMIFNVYGHHALRSPVCMFLRAAQDALQSGLIDAQSLSERDDAGAFVLIQDRAEPGSSSAILMQRLAERRPYHRALELDERHPSYETLVRLREDATWRKRVEEAWSRYLTRYRKGEAGPFDILIDVPERRKLPVGLRLIRRSPLPGERNPVSWNDLSGMSEDDLSRYHAPLHRIRIFTATEEQVSAVRRHGEELFTIAEEVG